ncbi:MAG: tyrosine-type recombinase/integrase [Brucella anthropi]
MSNTPMTISRLIEFLGDDLWSESKYRESAIIFLHEIADIKRDEFVTFRDDDYIEIANELRKRNNKNSTINRKINALTKLLRAAQKIGLIPHVPTFKRLSEDRTFLRVLSKEEEVAIIRSMALKAAIYGSLVEFLVDSGMTVGEAIAIRWENVEGRLVHIPETTKGAARTLPLTNRAFRAIADLTGEIRGPFERVEQPKFRIAWNEVKSELNLDADQAVVPTILRHTCASRLVGHGLNLYLVQHWLGNRDYKSMLKYEAFHRADNFNLCVAALEDIQR